jgi:glycosyltransferase involved in cell wall biosynthesis
MVKPIMKAKRALLIGPFPPPIGGDTVLTLNVSRSGYWREHGIALECIDTSPGDRVRVPDERLAPGDLLRGARVFLELVVKLPRCGTVLLWANSRFLLTAGIPIVVWCALFRKAVFVKVFGAFLARRICGTPQPWRAFALAALRRTAYILPETKTLARELVVEAGFPEDRLLVLPNFLPNDSFGAKRAPKRFSGRCAFFGQIKREKGVFDIIDALGGAAGTICDFYGPFLDRDREEFLRAISKYSNLSYKGAIEPGRVSRVAAGYDAVLLPTYHTGEGYPAVVLEAYAAGVPVVATNWLSLPEIVEDGVRGFLVPVRSPEKIREAVARFAADERLYESMRGNAFAYVESFSERAVIGDILVPLVERTLR